MPEILTEEQVAEWLHVPVATIKYLTRVRKIPIRKIGRKIFYVKSDLIPWFENSKEEYRTNVSL